MNDDTVIRCCRLACTNRTQQENSLCEECQAALDKRRKQVSWNANRFDTDASLLTKLDRKGVK